MRSKPLVLASLLLAAFLVNLDTTIVNVALPTLVRQLHASNAQLQWVVDAFNLLFAASVLAAGSLSDRFGRKGMLLCGLAVFGLASLAAGFMNSPGALIAARAVMGVGAAMVFPATLSILTNVFTERRERALAIGLWGAVTGMAIALGPIVGGWLLEVFDWRSIFIAMTPIAAVAGVMAARVVPTSRDPRAPRIDGAGFALSSAAIGLLVYTTIEAPTHGWGSTRTLASFAVTAALTCVFVAWERRVDEPMLDVRLFRNLRFTAASASVAISFFALSGFIFLVTQNFQFLKGYGPLSTGVRLLPVASFVAISSIVGTRIAVRAGTKLVVAAGLFSMAAFYLWVSTSDVTTSYATIAAQMVVLGTGMGLTSAPATEAIMGVVPKAKAGVGSAVNDATRLLGGTLGVAVIGSVYASLYTSRLGTVLPSGLPDAAGKAAHESVGAALIAAQNLASSGHPALAKAVHDAASTAFFHGFQTANYVAAGVAAAGAFMALVLLPAHPAADADQTPSAGSFGDAVDRNRAFAAAGGHEGAIVFPHLRLFVVTCLDPRTDPAHFLGLDLSDAMVVRNAGGRVTTEVINDIAFIAQIADKMRPEGPLFEVAVIHHNQCGTGALADDTFRRDYAGRIGAEESELRPLAVLDPEATVALDVERVRTATAIPDRVRVSGHVYDVETGLVETVIPVGRRPSPQM